MLVRKPLFESGRRWFDSSPRNFRNAEFGIRSESWCPLSSFRTPNSEFRTGMAPHASMAKPPAFNRQTQGSIPWRGTGSFLGVAQPVERRAENAEELVRLRPPGLGECGTRNGRRPARWLVPHSELRTPNFKHRPTDAATGLRSPAGWLDSSTVYSARSSKFRSSTFQVERRLSSPTWNFGT